jgi:hypothetical protein
MRPRAPRRRRRVTWRGDLFAMPSTPSHKHPKVCPAMRAVSGLAKQQTSKLPAASLAYLTIAPLSLTYTYQTMPYFLSTCPFELTLEIDCGRAYYGNTIRFTPGRYVSPTVAVTHNDDCHQRQTSIDRERYGPKSRRPEQTEAHRPTPKSKVGRLQDQHRLQYANHRQRTAMRVIQQS